LTCLDNSGPENQLIVKARTCDFLIQDLIFSEGNFLMEKINQKLNVF